MIEIRFDKNNNKSIAYDTDNSIKIGECEFIEVKEYWNIIHTEVSNSYQGQGIARKLVESIIENAHLNNKKIMAECSYGKKIIEKNKKSEYWDIYDSERKKTGRIAERGVYELKEGEYHVIVNAIIMNSKNEILISRRAAHKEFGLMWECSGGSILVGETSLEGMLREIKEELGLEFFEEDAIYLKEIRRDKIPPDFKDLWLFRKEVDLKDITFPDGEAIDAKFVSIKEFIDMYENKEIIPTVDFGIEDYNKILTLM